MSHVIARSAATKQSPTPGTACADASRDDEVTPCGRLLRRCASRNDRRTARYGPHHHRTNAELRSTPYRPGMGSRVSWAGMELRSLSYFVRIAELGSITRAASHLRVAQPALTRQVQRLEDELGVALFTRVNRGVRLTEAGQKLLESAIRILRDVERTGDEIRAHDAHPSGKIILGVTPTLCPVLVPELFSRMRVHYPMIELKVVHAGMVRLE